MFASLFGSKRASIDRSPYGEFWFSPIGAASAAGVRVTPDTAMRVMTVYSCVRVRSETFGMLPQRFYRKNGRNKNYSVDHPVVKLLTKRPNRFQNVLQFRENIEVHLSLRGNFYAQIIVNGRGDIVELLPLNPDKIRIIIHTDGNYSYSYSDISGKVIHFSRSEIWHIKGLAPDYYKGYSPIELARDAVGIPLAAQQYSARFFKNDARPSGGWIEHPGSFKDKEQKNSFRDAWQESQSGANRGKTAILEFGMKYHELGMTNADAQFIETQRWSVEELARLFAVPPHRIGHLDKATNNNIEHQGMEFINYTMLSITMRYEHSIIADLFFDDDAIEVETSFDVLSRGDSKSRAEYYKSGVLTGWLTRNEARENEGKQSLPGLDEPLVPLNMAPDSELEDKEKNEK